jgi:DNA repair protein RadC
VGVRSPYFEGTLIEKPREKADKIGIAALSDAELVALLLDTGNTHENVVEMSNRLLFEKGGLRGLMCLRGEGLVSFGVQKGKIYRLLACQEILKRLPLREEEKIVSATELYEKTKSFFFGAKTESVLLLFLALDKTVLKRSVFALGDESRVFVPLAKVIRDAISCASRFVLIIHNHPSGVLQPSASDIELTDSLTRGLSAVGIRLLDSLISAEGGYFSFREQGRLRD